MNILHLTTHLNRGGISQYLLSVGADFVQRGHSVWVVSGGGEMEPEFSERNIKVKNFSIRTKSELSPKIYAALPSLIRWIRKEKIDVIHAHTRVTQVMGFWLSFFTGRAYVSTVHGFFKRRLGRRLFPAWGDRAVAISDAVGADLRETHQVPAECIRVIYNGLDLKELSRRFSAHDPLQARKEYGFGPNSFVVGIIARLVSDKGHEYLLEAVKLLVPKIPEIRLLIVGDGKYRRSLEEVTRAMDLKDRVFFTGNLKDVSRPLAAIDVFVLPAVWREGFGFSIVEAMACKKPVIVTNIWALNTLIQNHENGILVEPRDAQELAQALQLILKDQAFRNRIGKAGYETAERRFSLDRMVLELENVYREALSR